MGRPPRRARWVVPAALAAAALLELVRRRRPAPEPVARLAGAAPGTPLEPVAVVANPNSGGGGEPELDGHRLLLPGEDEDLRDVVRRAADEGAATIGVMGGDGTVRCAAALAAERGRTLWVVPGGTLNHFARALGVPDEETARAALEDGLTAEVDLGVAGDEVFVNTAALGAYGDIVRRRERLEGRLPKGVALVLASAATLARARPLALTIDGRPERVWLLFAGNNPYEGLGLTGRSSLQRGVLDLRVLRAPAHLPRLTVILRILAGRLRRSPWLRQTLVREVRVGLPGPVQLALDGELVDVEGEIMFRSAPRALRVVVPAPEDARVDATAPGG